MEERLQKLISAAGITSRRRAEGYITEGRVTVNGQVALLGQRADPDRDEICLDGKRILKSETRHYFVLHKPRGYVTTMEDEKGRKTAAQLMEGCGCRVYPVGRLDMDSEGLLLFTDDGELTNRLIHPRHEVEKEYRVRVQGNIPAALPVLRGKIELDGCLLAPAQVKPLNTEPDGGLISVVIHEGKNRQVRRMCAMAGLKVLRLCRVREGSLRLGGLKPGQWRALTGDEVERLRQL